MAFSFYQSLKTLPADLDAAATLYRLPRWQRFKRLEVPAAMIGLVWKAMMSFGGGWFFLAASEAISVLNQSYTLPGIGSYVAAAVQASDMRALALALLTMVLIIVLIDQVFWRPIVAWSDKFKFEQRAAAEAPQSWILDLLRTSRWPRLLGLALSPINEWLDVGLSKLGTPRQRPPRTAGQGWGDWAFNGGLTVAIVIMLAAGARFVTAEVGLSEVERAFLLGLATFGRVVVLLIVSTLIWVPVGVAIGFSPRLAQWTHPRATSGLVSGQLRVPVHHASADPHRRR